MNIREVTKLFKTDDDCLAYIQQMRWPDGIVRCLMCGTDNPVKVDRTSKSKNRRTWFYLCSEKSCRAQFSPTAGTIFHGTHIPLIVWFHAIAIILNAKKGISALQLQRDLGIGGYKTAWYLNHRIREAMAEGAIPTLGGTVEIDETYVGGKQKGKGVYYGKKQKQTVVGLRERKGQLRLVHTPDAKAKTLKAVIESHVSPEADQIMSDTASATYFAVKQLGYEHKHKTINHIIGQYVKGDVHTNTIESAFSLLKRGVIGSYHRISIKHLQRYLNEFSYRFNRREDENAFIETVRRLCGFAPLTFTALTSEKA